MLIGIFLICLLFFFLIGICWYWATSHTNKRSSYKDQSVDLDIDALDKLLSELPIDKGKMGELEVAEILGETVPYQQYVLHNLLFKTHNNKSCEIDHVYINKYGVWVIETKNYSGKIYGNEKQLHWTQIFYNGESNQFYNPIKQNSTHIYHLSQFLKMQYIFHNVVVFLDADISDISSNILYTLDNLDSIKERSTKVQLSASQMEFIYQKLLHLKENRAVTKQKHIENIHREQLIIEYGFCPRCGRKLVLRQGKYGEFYGCPNYPKCKFTKKID